MLQELASPGCTSNCSRTPHFGQSIMAINPSPRRSRIGLVSITSDSVWHWSHFSISRSSMTVVPHCLLPF